MNADTGIDSAELDKELDGELVSFKQGTRRYIEGHVVISQANRIFGYDRWGYGIEDLQPLTLETIDKETKETKLRTAYRATVTVRVTNALPRTDIGFCEVSDETVNGHDTAIKGAVTDAMKRAFRTFGNQFGNSLYDRSWQPNSQTRQNGQHAARPQNGTRIASQQQLQYIENLGKKLYNEEWIASARDMAAAQWASDGAAETLADLTPAQASKLIDLLKNQTPAQTAVNGQNA